MKQKRNFNGTIVKRIASFVLLTSIVFTSINQPNCSMPVKAEMIGASEPSADVFLSKELLDASPEDFNAAYNIGYGGREQKVYFGKDIGEYTGAQSWYIAGKNSDGTLVLMCDINMPLRSSQVFLKNYYARGENGIWVFYYDDTVQNYANDYEVSDIRKYLISNILEDGVTQGPLAKFTTREQELMCSPNIYTARAKGEKYLLNDKLYLAYGEYGGNYVRNKYITVGNNSFDSLYDGLKIDIESGLYSTGKNFWCRAAEKEDGYTRCAIDILPGSAVGCSDVDSDEHKVLPAFHLNLQSAMFASAATTSTGEAVFDSDNAMYFRFDGEEIIKSSVSEYADKLNVIKSVEDEDDNIVRPIYLYVQGRNENKDWIYSKAIDSTQIITLDEIKNDTRLEGVLDIDLSKCKIWLEKTVDNVTYAKGIGAKHDFIDDNGINDSGKELCSICNAKNINYFELDEKVISNDSEYSGSPLTSDISITGLIKGTDYIVDDITYTEPGVYSIKVFGIGDYAGERIITWKIVAGEPVLTMPEPSAQYKQILGDIEIANPTENIAGVWEWKNPDTVLDTVGDMKCLVVFTPEDAIYWYPVEKEITVSVDKAPSSAKEKYIQTYYYCNEYLDESIELTPFVPEDATNVTYTVVDETFAENDTVENCVIEDGKLIYNVSKMDTFAAGTSTTISIKVSSENYADFVQLIEIIRADCEHSEDMIMLKHNTMPGCETAGEDIKICTRCGATVEAGIVIDALGHDYVEDICIREECGAVLFDTSKNVEVTIKGVRYDGDSHLPEIIVTYREEILSKGIDYSVIAESESEIGTYELKIIGIGKYKGEISRKWSVIPEEGLWCKEIPDQTYTGKEIKPVIDVYCNGNQLVEKRDYVLTFKNNIKVAAIDEVSRDGRHIAPTVTIKGKGNYTDKMVLNFAIVPCRIDSVPVEDITVVKTGKDIKINPIVTLNNNRLKKGTDYVISASEDIADAVSFYKEAGVYNLYIVGMGNYSGSVPFKFTIAEGVPASKVKIAKISAREYDGGKEIKPDATITYGNIDVTDKFDVAYRDNTEIGIATVVATAKENSGFVGTKTVTFKITGKNIASVKMGLDGKKTLPSAIYSGKEYRPELELYDGSTLLVDGTDYTVKYTKNVNVGVGLATVTGIGKYAGTKKYSFTINRYDAAADEAGKIVINGGNAINVCYEKGGVFPKPIITKNGISLTKDVDYKLKYSNNKAVADKSANSVPVVNIIFKGNYTGTKTVPFTITEKDISQCSISIADKTVNPKPNQWKQKVLDIVDTNGKKLVAKMDYDPKYEYYIDEECKTEINEAVLDAGTTVYVKVKGINNYAGSEIVGNYRISLKNIATVKTVIVDKAFTGSEVCPTAEEVVVTVGTGKNMQTLKAGEDYEIVPGSYTNNVNSGIAKLKIRGKGEYFGTKVVVYKIYVNKFFWWDR